MLIVGKITMQIHTESKLSSFKGISITAKSLGATIKSFGRQICKRKCKRDLFLVEKHSSEYNSSNLSENMKIWDETTKRAQSNHQDYHKDLICLKDLFPKMKAQIRIAVKTTYKT